MAGRGTGWGFPEPGGLLVGSIGLLILGFFSSPHSEETRPSLQPCRTLVEKQYNSKNGWAGSLYYSSWLPGWPL